VLVIDEADRILEIGFEEDMRAIIKFLPKKVRARARVRVRGPKLNPNPNPNPSLRRGGKDRALTLALT